MLHRRPPWWLLAVLGAALPACGGTESPNEREPCPAGGCPCVDETCRMDCTDPDSCDVECTDGADCELECGASDVCTVECVELGDCYVDCGTSTTCTVHCAIGSHCECDGDSCFMTCDEEASTCTGGPCECG